MYTYNSLAVQMDFNSRGRNVGLFLSQATFAHILYQYQFDIDDDYYYYIILY